MAQVAIRVDDDLKKEWQLAAKADGRSLSGFVKIAVGHFLRTKHAERVVADRSIREHRARPMTEEEEEARDRLLFQLENDTAFWFALVVSDDPRPRDRLREVAETWCKEYGRTFILHEPAPDGLVRLAVELARGDSPGVHWIRADGAKGVIEAWDAGATQMLMAMNERREAYRKRLEGAILVEGRSSLKRILREMAPDMFSIRSFIAEPGEDPIMAMPLGEYLDRGQDKDAMNPPANRGDGPRSQSWHEPEEG